MLTRCGVRDEVVEQGAACARSYQSWARRLSSQVHSLGACAVQLRHGYVSLFLSPSLSLLTGTNYTRKESSEPCTPFTWQCTRSAANSCATVTCIRLLVLLHRPIAVCVCGGGGLCVRTCVCLCVCVCVCVCVRACASFSSVDQLLRSLFTKADYISDYLEPTWSSVNQVPESKAAVAGTHGHTRLGRARASPPLPGAAAQEENARVPEAPLPTPPPSPCCGREHMPPPAQWPAASTPGAA